MGLTDAQRAHFRDRGFVVLESFFDTDTVEQISGWLDALSEKTPGDGEEAKYYEKSVIDGHDLLVRVEHIFTEKNARIRDLILCEEAIACLTDLLGEAPVLFKEKVNYKLPGCRADKLHQDQAAGWNTYGDYFISMAVAVDENRLDNAALTFLSSGNYEKTLMTQEWQPLTDQDPPFSPAGDYRLLEANPGDVILFDSYVPHGSPANLSKRSRRNLFLTFNRRSHGDQRERYYREKWASYPPNAGEAARPASSFRV